MPTFEGSLLSLAGATLIESLKGEYSTWWAGPFAGGEEHFDGWGTFGFDDSFPSAGVVAPGARAVARIPALGLLPVLLQAVGVDEVGARLEFASTAPPKPDPDRLALILDRVEELSAVDADLRGLIQGREVEQLRRLAAGSSGAFDLRRLSYADSVRIADDPSLSTRLYLFGVPAVVLVDNALAGDRDAMRQLEAAHRDPEYREIVEALVRTARGRRILARSRLDYEAERRELAAAEQFRRDVEASRADMVTPDLGDGG